MPESSIVVFDQRIADIMNTVSNGGKYFQSFRNYCKDLSIGVSLNSSITTIFFAIIKLDSKKDNQQDYIDANWHDHINPWQ